MLNSLAGKQPLISAPSNLLDAALVGTGLVSNIEFNYLDGVTSSIQSQLNTLSSTKQNNIVNSPSIYSLGNNQFGVYGQSQGRYNLFANQTTTCWYKICNILLTPESSQISFELVGTNDGSLQNNVINNFRLWINSNLNYFIY